jgi:AraC family transcriptional activator of pobA
MENDTGITMAEDQIKTYDTAHFREHFIEPETRLADLMKAGFGRFFIVRVEQMLKLIKLPVPPVRATSHTLIYLTEGEGNMTIGSENYQIRAHECLVVPAGQVFSFDKRDVNKGYLCNFHNDMIVGKFGKNELLKDFGFLHVWGDPQITLDAEVSGFVNSLFERILLEYETNRLGRLDILQPYFIALLCEINGVYKPVSAASQSNAVHISNRFRELVFAHFREQHSVAEYASMLHITPNHLNKAVKSITGKSPTKWIDEAIVLEAKVLLHQSQLPISSIATAVGLADASYFSRLFRKYEGITPITFRKWIEKS